MTTYYVRESGNDGNTGLSPAQAWLTINYGVNNMAAGDTLWVGAGVYTEQVTVTAGGSAGSPKIIRGDFDGVETGDGGIVVLTAHEYANQPPSWNYAIDLNEEEFIEFYDMVIVGGNIGVFGDDDATADWALEGVEFHNCCLATGSDSMDYVLYVDLNDGATPTVSGLMLDKCTLSGVLWIVGDRNAVQHYNLKWSITNCVVFGRLVSGNYHDCFLYLTAAGADAFSYNGVDIEHCTVMGVEAVAYHGGIQNATNQTIVRECSILSSTYIARESTSVNDTIQAYNNRYWHGTGTGFSGDIDDAGLNDQYISVPLMAGLADIMYRNVLGWSPWVPWEPMPSSSVIGQGVTAGMLSDDLFSRPRPMGEDNVWLFYFTASDAGPTDPDAAWLNDANAFNYSTASNAHTPTQGDEDNNELLGEGIDMPGASCRIGQVRVRFYMGVDNPGSDEIAARVYTDGLAETLGTVTSSAATGWTAWQTLTEPAGGWGTMDDVQHLEVKYWKNTAVVGSAIVACGQLEVTMRGGEDVGAVQSRARAHREQVVVPAGFSDSGKLEGAGVVDFLRPVDAALTTFTVQMRYDSNYTGNLPRIQVLQIPDGVADQTDTMAAAADTWETLTCSFTPTVAGWCILRIESRDTSGDGICYFGDIG